MKQEYKEAFTEVNEIIKMMPDELVNKIPSKFREMIEDERDKEYNPNIQEPLEKCELKNETIIIKNKNNINLSKFFAERLFI